MLFQPLNQFFCSFVELKKRSSIMAHVIGGELEEEVGSEAGKTDAS